MGRPSVTVSLMSLCMPAAAPATAPSIDRGSGARRRRTVVPLHDQPTVAHGGLTQRAIRRTGRYVSATEFDGLPVWIDASTVWVDAHREAPAKPVQFGLATAIGIPELAVIAGLSDRLGHEAALVEPGALPDAPVREAGRTNRLLDGRCGHQVPTVVVVGSDRISWGAGNTWDAAFGRALFGDRWPAAPGELDELVATLAEAGVGVAVADLGTPVLAAAGVHRLSVQLTCRDTAGR
jgi:hypothetical protein